MNKLLDIKTAMQQTNEPLVMSKKDTMKSLFVDAFQDKTSNNTFVGNRKASYVSGDSTVKGLNLLLDFYIETVSKFARLREDLLVQNVICVAQGIPEDDRLMSLESFMFVAKHFGVILSALILDYKNVRRLFANALGEELDFLKLEKDERVNMHKSFGDYWFEDFTHPVELGATMYGDDVQQCVLEVMSKSISSLLPTPLWSEVTTTFYQKYDQQSCDDVGAILSNPVFFLVAVNHNAHFVEMVSHICEELLQQYNVVS